jgi:hypothetical protein
MSADKRIIKTSSVLVWSALILLCLFFAVFRPIVFHKAISFSSFSKTPNKNSIDRLNANAFNEKGFELSQKAQIPLSMSGAQKEAKETVTPSEKNAVRKAAIKTVFVSKVGEEKPIVQKKVAEKIAQYETTKYYMPYLQIGGTRFSNENSNAAAVIDLFVPLWQQGLADLIFSDIRINDRTGVPFEGNIHLGYRHLFPDGQKMFGVYGAFDRMKTGYENYFNQITLGGEYWFKNWFVGGNIYKPIGDTSKIGQETPGEVIKYGFRGLALPVNRAYEKAVPGVDAEIGYEFTKGLVGYVGGYYFNANEVDTVGGPRARLTYDWSLESGKRILGVFDQVGLEVGIQRDKPRGTICYLSVNVRIGWPFDKKPVLHGISRHMTDPVRRDIDIISSEIIEEDLVFNLGPDGAPEKVVYVASSVSLESSCRDDTVDRILMAEGTEERVNFSKYNIANKLVDNGEYVFKASKNGGHSHQIRLRSKKYLTLIDEYTVSFKALKVENLSFKSFKTHDAVGLKHRTFKTVKFDNLDSKQFRAREISGLDPRIFNSRRVLNLEPNSFKTHEALGLNIDSFRTREVLGLDPQSFKTREASGLDIDSFKTHEIFGLDPRVFKARRVLSLESKSFKTREASGLDIDSFRTREVLGLDPQSFKTHEIFGLDPRVFKARRVLSLESKSFKTREALGPSFIKAHKFYE